MVELLRWLTGDQRVLAVEVDPGLIEDGDQEILEDLILTAINQGLDNSRKVAESRVGTPRRTGTSFLRKGIGIMLPEPIQQCIDVFANLPGIGPKTGARLVYLLLGNRDSDLSTKLADSLSNLISGTDTCPICFNMMNAGQEECSICGNDNRDGRE